MMHIKPFFVVVLMLGWCTTAIAQVRTAEDAQHLADAFWPLKRGGENPSKTMVYTEKDTVSQHPYFYVFNRGDNEGFVIISADERSKQILGYSDTGRFDVNDVPAEMQAWLRVYQKELKHLSLTPDSLLRMDLNQLVMSKGLAPSFAASVEPLLGDINYSQSYPYNMFCPQVAGQVSVTGCVATAAAQVMRYWRFPQSPTGKSHSYDLYGQQIGTTYNTAYDWSNMLSNYGTYTGTAHQQEAVARLMYDAGVACDMEYTPSASGALTNDMARGLVEYFGYDLGTMVYQRCDFTQADFVYYLKRELNAGRPVLVSGTGSGGGHCFVCDGYDTNGLFHINWGWNGQSNGYFQLTNLSPSSLGIGGGAGGFNDEVMFIGGIQPPCANSRPVYALSFREMFVPERFAVGKKVKVTLMSVANSSLFSYNGHIGVGLYRDGKLWQVLGSEKISMETGRYCSSLLIQAKLPSGTPSGSYQMVMVCKSDGDDVWRACLNNYCNCIDIEVVGKNVECEYNLETHYCDLPDNGYNNLANASDDGAVASAQEATGNTLTVDMPAGGLSLVKPISFADNSHVVNGQQAVVAQMVSPSDFVGKVGVLIFDKALERCVATLQVGSLALTGGQPTDCTFTGVLDLAQGEYYATLVYVDGESGWQQVQPNRFSCVPFTVVPASLVPSVTSGANVRPGERRGAK